MSRQLTEVKYLLRHARIVALATEPNSRDVQDFANHVGNLLADIASFLAATGEIGDAPKISVMKISDCLIRAASLVEDRFAEPAGVSPLKWQRFKVEIQTLAGRWSK